MNILDTIVAHKKMEVTQQKQQLSVQQLQQKKFFNQEVFSLKNNFLQSSTTGIIAEFKRKSPSKGFINEHANLKQITNAYAQHGASAISILTDNHFFGGNINDLEETSNLAIPLLRKDFIIDEYQIIQSKAIGASVILLIAACLTKLKVKQMSALAKSIGLEVLLEIHDEAELEYICDTIDFVGVNNRNLKTFEVSIETSLQLIKQIPTNKFAISESGISTVQTIVTLKNEGFKGFLIGENFMKNINPAIAFENFVHQLKQQLNEY